MTLATSINLLEPCDPERIFGLARQIIGIPQEQPFTVTTGPDDLWKERREDFTEIHSTPAGFNAALYLDIVPNGDGDFANLHERYCTEYPDDCHCRRWFTQVGLNTTYGFDPCCTCLHYGIIRQLAPHLGAFEWQDEYTGDWFRDLPPEHCPHHGGVMPVSLAVIA